MNETHSILQRMRELAVQSSNDTNNDSDRKELQKEIDQLSEEITRIANTTEFNTKKLFGADENDRFTGKFHIGANAEQNIELSINAMDAKSLGVAEGGTELETANSEDVKVDGQDFTGQTVLKNGDEIVAVEINGEYYNLSDVTAVEDDADPGTYNLQAKTGAKALEANDDGKYMTKAGGIDISSQENADTAITTINEAIEKVSAERSKLGAYQNRLEHTINNLSTSSENLTAAESRIRDVDYTEAA
ncbi:hypothetical protein J8TS2_04950 [Lederbergia ruris]|uniref:Flagellin n=1 Tax=Lederbergia ruris TaxID=217495 RepID=A0ABQ4KFK6_9BACI|nr:hypothetical protein J8TS2_04950 [Lederbergia ruris]